MEIHEDKIIMRAGTYDLPKPWIGLTEDEKDKFKWVWMKSDAQYSNINELIDGIEQTLKERNT
jgi:hypothetical protein